MVTDPGIDDEIQLTVVTGPETFQVERGLNGAFVFSWAVPNDAEGDYEIEIAAHDGQTILGEWHPDGGESVLKFALRVVPLIIVDAALPEPDAYVPSFDEIKGDSVGCEASDPTLSWFTAYALLFLLLGPIIRRRL